MTCDLRKAEGQQLFRRLAAQADVLCENFRPGTMEEWGLGPERPRDRPRLRADQRLRAGRSVRTATGPRPPGHRLRRAAPSNRRARPAAGTAGRDHLGLPHRRLRRAMAAVAGLFERTQRGRWTRPRRASSTPPSTESVLRVLEWTLAAYDTSGQVRSREGNRMANSAPLDNYPAADGAYVCIVAGSDANFSTPVPGDGSPRPDRGPPLRHARRRAPSTATRSTISWPRGRSGPGCGGRSGLRRTWRPGGDRLQLRRHLRRPSHGGPGRPGHRRGPGDGHRPPAGAVPPFRRPAGADPHRRPAPRRRQPPGLVRAGRPSPEELEQLRRDGVV